jgi:hypothetical protein
MLCRDKFLHKDEYMIKGKGKKFSFKKSLEDAHARDLHQLEEDLKAKAASLAAKSKLTVDKHENDNTQNVFDEGMEKDGWEVVPSLAQPQTRVIEDVYPSSIHMDTNGSTSISLGTTFEGFELVEVTFEVNNHNEGCA